jgi:hypothetical protein
MLISFRLNAQNFPAVVFGPQGFVVVVNHIGTGVTHLSCCFDCVTIEGQMSRGSGVYHCGVRIGFLLFATTLNGLER